MRLFYSACASMLIAACQNVNDPRASESTASGSQALAGSVTTQLAVDLSRSGQMSIAAAKVIPDTVVLSPTITSEYAYEVISGGKVIAAQPLPELHLARGIAKPGSVEEYRGSQDTTRVLIYVPGKSETDEDYEVVVHRLNTIPAGQAVSPSNFAAVAQANGASVFARVNGKGVAARIRELRASGH